MFVPWRAEDGVRRLISTSRLMSVELRQLAVHLQEEVQSRLVCVPEHKLTEVRCKKHFLC